VQSSRSFTSVFTSGGFLLGQVGWHWRPQPFHPPSFSSLSIPRFQEQRPARATAEQKPSNSSSQAVTPDASARENAAPPAAKKESSFFDSGHHSESLPPGWEDNPDFNITTFAQLPHREFGYNQFIQVNEEFKEALRQMLWQFRAPIRYAFAYGSGVFSQSSPDAPPIPPSLSPHPHPPEAIVTWQKGGGKIIDFIFGVSYTQHWHSINLTQHRDHYSFLGAFGSGLVSWVQDKWGAGVYFNPYITVNGTMIKYGVVNLDTIAEDLSEWKTLYLAGRLQKPVKILRDDPKVRLANQINLISAVRAALLMLGPEFTEIELYNAIAGMSYLGDPRMQFRSENPNKVLNIVKNQLPNFRQLYNPLIEDLPNVAYNDSRQSSLNWLNDSSCDCKMVQDMDPVKRGNMVRRLPKAFRKKIYFAYQKKFEIPGQQFQEVLEEAKDEDAVGFKRREGGEFDRRIAREGDVAKVVKKTIGQTVSWPSTSQSLKSFLTAGPGRGMRYLREKRQKAQEPAKEAKSHQEKSE